MIRFSFAVSALAAACLLPAASSAAPSHAARPVCGYAGYSYAGFQSLVIAYGVAARVTALASPSVRSGHVAAWIGIGGAGMGPGGSDEWLQVGIEAGADRRQQLYYEYAQPGISDPVIVPLGRLTIGEAHDLSLQEPQSGAWQVWLDGRRVSPLIVLPGSHGAWRPIATAETWDGGIRGCNHYRYAFSNLAVETTPGGSWQRFPLAQPIRAPGFAVTARPYGFTATTER